MTDPARGERVSVVGSRAHPNLGLVRAYVRSLPPGTVVVSGGAEGVDRAAEETARSHGYQVISYRVVGPHGGEPRYSIEELSLSRYDQARLQRIYLDAVSDWRTALIFRNTFIALSDRSVVWPDGSKGGCFDEANQAVRFKRPVELRWDDGRVEAYTGKRPARPLPTLPKRDGLIEPGVHISNKGCRNAYTNTSCPCAEGTCWVTYARAEHKAGEPALDIGAFIAQQRRAAQRG